MSTLSNTNDVGAFGIRNPRRKLKDGKSSSNTVLAEVATARSDEQFETFEHSIYKQKA